MGVQPIINVLSCLACRKSELVVEAYTARCPCGATYPMMRGAIDFRNADRDLSAGYDIALDNAFAACLNEVFDTFSTFHELRYVLALMRAHHAKGLDLADFDPVSALAEANISPVPYGEADAAHGRSVLAKVPLYLEGTGLPEMSAGVALEDGSGEGFFVTGLAENFRHVLVLDLSMAYILLAAKIIAETGLSNVTLICASAEHLPVKDDSIDFVHSNNVIEHVANQGKMIAEANRVLHPRGLLFMMSPNRFSLYFEPHFRLPGFGFFPESLRRRIVTRASGQNIDDIGLRSLAELRLLVRRNFGGPTVFSFIPRRLTHTETGGKIRTTLTWALNMPGVGIIANFALNKLALGVMPYHVVLGSKSQSS